MASFMKICGRIASIKLELDHPTPNKKRIMKLMRKVRKGAGDAEALYYGMLAKRDFGKLVALLKEQPCQKSTTSPSAPSAQKA